MANNFLLSVATPLLLLLLLSPLRITAGPVLDVEGDPVVVHNRYLIKRTISLFGGLTASRKILINKCPLYVVQGGQYEDGTPVVFNPASSTNNNTIEESSDVHISFKGDAMRNCIDGTWRLITDPFDGYTYVSTGTGPPEPEPEPLKNLFKIERLRYGFFPLYKITYCSKPQVLGELEVCEDLSYVNHQSRFIGVGNDALDFAFVKF